VLVMGDDISEIGGPWFLYTPLQFNDTVTADGQHVVLVGQGITHPLSDEVLV
jgi:hypothetical protein